MKKPTKIRLYKLLSLLLESLKELENSKSKFDLIFIDADKENYLNYYEKCIRNN